ncbi:MAG TPA: ester cyclase [Thermomicrobiaceae bacterium]|nr:ester cyclase [Thermomicrobiaceae bacterium]
MGTQQNKELVRRYFAAMDRGDVDGAAALWSPDAINHASGRPGLQPPPGSAMLGDVFRSLHQAFPDRRWQIDDLIAEGDTVVCRMTVSGTYGENPPLPVESTFLITAPPMGRPYSVTHIHVLRVAEERIVEHWAARDDLGLLLQLGVISRPETAPGAPSPR